MPNEGTNSGASANSAELRTCSRCGKPKPVAEFYRSPATICKRCQNRASRFSNQCRRAALAHLIALHSNEYRRLLAAERARHDSSLSDLAGGDSDAA
jgi:recombinational DNA repair protein (RecF pathway)